MTNERDIDKLVIDMPCPIPWDYMKGDHKIRYCDICELSVHNLSAMTEAEIEQFLGSNAGKDRVCVAMYRRPDGTIVTDRCPAGLRKLRDTGLGLLRVVAGFAAVVMSTSVAWAQRTVADGSVKDAPKVMDAATKAQWDQALAAFRSNKLKEAMILFAKITPNDPSRKSEYYRGLCLKGLKDYNGARAAFVRAARESNDAEVKSNSKKSSAEMMALIDNSTPSEKQLIPPPPRSHMAGGICPQPPKEDGPAPNSKNNQQEKPEVNDKSR